MKTHLIIGIKLTLLTIVLFGVVYPLLITGIARIVAPNRGHGEEITANGRIVGFKLIGQKFDDPRYFNSRPSAVDYNAAATGGSNKGPTNPEYLVQVQGRIDSFLVQNPQVNKHQIPVDLITAPGSGLDPHVSPEAAFVQVQRIANVRQIDPKRLKQLVAAHIEEGYWGIFGIPRVNLLELNIALDELK